MADKVTPIVRARMMSAIKAKDTSPEMAIRRGLHAAGFRYRVHVSDLPGKPDIVLPKYKALIWINGCFWHGHTCRDGRLPQSRIEYWQPKIARTRERDAAAQIANASDGWRSLIIWECSFRRQGSEKLFEVIRRAKKWILLNEESTELD